MFEMSCYIKHAMLKRPECTLSSTVLNTLANKFSIAWTVSLTDQVMLMSKSSLEFCFRFLSRHKISC